MTIMYDTAVIIILVLLIPAMFCLGYVCKKPEYKPTYIRTIKIGSSVELSVNTDYILLIDFPKGQDKGL